MRHPRRGPSLIQLGLLAALLAMVLVAVGCSSSTTTTSSSTGGSTSPGSTATAGSATTTAGAYNIKAILAGIKADPALKVMLPAANQSTGVKVASDIPYMPWEGFVGDTNQPTGFDYDLSQALGAKLGIKFDFIKVVFDSIIIGIQSKKYDIAMSDMYDNAARQKTLDFVDYANDTTSVITLKGNPKKIVNLDTLAGLNVGCEKGTTQAALLEKLNTQFRSAGKPAMTVKQFPAQPDSLLALQSGQIDCDVTDHSTAFYNAETTKKGTELVFELVVDPAAPEGYDPTPVGIGILKENSQLRDAIQKALQALIDDGTYKTIVSNWGPVGVTSAQINTGK